MNKYLERLYNGVIKENPTLILLLGMCPTLAVSTQATNGIGMGLSTTAVLILSNVVISALRKVIPDQVRLPAYIVIVASLVTVTELLMKVVNCIILGRAEAYANKHSVGLSAMDGLGMGIGFTLALTLAAAVREILGSGTAFGVRILPAAVEPIGIFVQPPGAFLVIALFIGIMNAIGIKTRQRELVESGCDGCCATCAAACQKKEAADK